MTSKRALSILKEHRDILNDDKFDKFYPWHQQFISYVDGFLGKESNEYKLVTNFEYPKQKPNKEELDLMKYVFQTHINQAIETITKVGIKRNYHNFLCRFSDKELIAGILASASVIFGAGYWAANLIHHFSPK
jgi:hypothetical protein